MQIQLINAGKRFNREWIFRNVNLIFRQGKSYAITGPNGSGKSTLIQLIAGYIQPSEGSVQIENGILPEHMNFSMAAPYMELMEEMTALEQVNFHLSFRQLTMEPDALLKEAGLEGSFHKSIRYFSSGMKQRIKLALAFHSASLVLMLDEPTTNLDEEGISLYKKWIAASGPEKILIIGSNDREEYSFCDHLIDLRNLS